MCVCVLYIYMYVCALYIYMSISMCVCNTWYIYIYRNLRRSAVSYIDVYMHISKTIMEHTYNTDNGL